MASQVFFHDARASAKKNRLEKVKSLFARAKFPGLISAGDRVAIKVHWGEPGNVGFIEYSGLNRSPISDQIDH